ncbi:protein EGG APPARATUS-1-like [Brachypodium distachyon]|uniref:protein EGG APPARATUS-1-like n=1 Tax=Brachypodium distachyon TaxID=15368 RepID=UPI0001C75729|nr:protein EGG APPARATUS-1-like [Brachypodium distachyon]|eukprot:XP_024312789.1 protein EGG APPARATUS-1-like [Brachypodium distachyon]
MAFHGVAAAVAVGAVAVGAYVFWPAAVVTAGAMMKAPGAAGYFISRAAFEANPQLYFELLRTVGAKAAAAAFAFVA